MAKPMTDERLYELKQYIVKGSTYTQDVRYRELIAEIERLNKEAEEWNKATNVHLSQLQKDNEELCDCLEAAEKVCFTAPHSDTCTSQALDAPCICDFSNEYNAWIASKEQSDSFRALLDKRDKEIGALIRKQEKLRLRIAQLQARLEAAEKYCEWQIGCGNPHAGDCCCDGCELLNAWKVLKEQSDAD